jgi:hypothetical protein
VKSIVSKSFQGMLLLVASCFSIAGGCSKENKVDASKNAGTCNIPAGTCPEGFSPVATGEGSIEECEENGEGACKQVGSCTVRCEDPRGCTAVGASCGDDSEPACCGEPAGHTTCVHFINNDDPDRDVQICAAHCDSNADCPDSCCDGSINNGSLAVCAPYNVCITATGAPEECLTCLEEACPEEWADCQADETCLGCAEGEIYGNSPDCRNNAVLKKGYGCALQMCPDVCDMF